MILSQLNLSVFFMIFYQSKAYDDFKNLSTKKNQLKINKLMFNFTGQKKRKIKIEISNIRN